MPITRLIPKDELLSSVPNTISFERYPELKNRLFDLLSLASSGERTKSVLGDLLCCLPQVEAHAEDRTAPRPAASSQRSPSTLGALAARGERQEIEQPVLQLRIAFERDRVRHDDNSSSFGISRVIGMTLLPSRNP